MAFRAVTSVFNTSVAGSSLAADPAAALAMINASPYVKEQLAEDGVYVHTIEAASTRYMADRFAFLSGKTVSNIADDCRRGISFMTKHAVGGAFAGPGENPYGRTFAGQYEQRADVTRALAQFYMLRAHSPNGASSPSTDDLHRGLVGGTLFDFSVGLTRGGLDLRTCDVCSNEIFSLQCSHCPGTLIGMSDAEIAAQVARGVPEGKASFTFDDWHSGEVSLVFNGAIPFAGTSFAAGRGAAAKPAKIQLAASDEPAECACCADDSIECGCASKDESADGACSCDSSCNGCSDNGCDGSTDMATHQEEGMAFTTEQKLKLGLAATATDDQVIEKINATAAQNATLATQNETLLATQKTAGDTAFSAKWTEKLGAETVTSLLALPNREDVATAFAAKLDAKAAGETVKEPPPMGDPLKGAALAAAPATEKSTGATAESEFVREGLGNFATNAEVEKYALTSPLKALAGVLGLPKLSTSGAHQVEDKNVIENRRQMFGIAATPPAAAAAAAAK